jgi:tetratricopeptide (TPR) repeat protein
MSCAGRCPLTLLLPLLLLWAVPARAEKLHCPSVTDNDEKNNEIARRYFQMGGIYHDKQDHLKAAEAFECVLKFVPYSLTARYRLARAYDGMAVYSRAREHYEMILVYDSAEAESLKPEIRKRLAEIKDLKDRVTVVTVPVEPAVVDDKSCPPVVVKGQQEALAKVEKLMDGKSWLKARQLLDETLKKLDGATPAQRKLCMSAEAGLGLLLHAGIVHFNLNNLQDAGDLFTQVFRLRPESVLPKKYETAALMEFFQKTSSAYFASVQAEKEKQLRIRQLEEGHGIAPEPAENPTVALEHEPQAKIERGKPLVFVCRVQDGLSVAKVVLSYRIDDGAAREEVLEKLGTRRWVTVVPGAGLSFVKFAYHLVAYNAGGDEVAAWGSAEKPHVFELPPEKAPDPGPGVTGPVTGPVPGPVPVKPKAPGRSWRIYPAPSVGYDFGLIPRKTVTELGAYTENLGWGRNAPVFVTEVGLLFRGGRQRVSVGVRQSTIQVRRLDPRGEPENVVKSESQPQFFARSVHFLSVDSVVRPYLGGGGFGGPLRVSVAHENLGLGGTDPGDTYELGGAFLNAIAGVQLCMGSGCRVAIQAEVNLLWKFGSPMDDPIFSTDYMKTVVFWLSTGLAFNF